MLHRHTLDSKVASEIAYDSEAKVMFINFAKANADDQIFPCKWYRYFDVPETHFAAIREQRRLKDSGNEEASEGSHILKFIVGPRKGLAPFKFEKLEGDPFAEDA